jgi:hypothetical protein
MKTTRTPSLNDWIVATLFTAGLCIGWNVAKAALGTACG